MQSSPRRVRYSVAMSLDGYIAGPNGEFDWIVMDPDIDFEAGLIEFDTELLGRRTYETTRQLQSSVEVPATPSMTTFVCSKSLLPQDCKGVVVSADAVETVSALRQQHGSIS